MNKIAEDARTSRPGATHDIDRLRRDVSLSSTVEHYGYKLERNGHEFETCCPFHAEDTPSFTIFVGQDGVERFQCFGCGEKGDVLDFVQKVKGVNLPEAIRILDGRDNTRPNVQPRKIQARNAYDGVTAITPPADILQPGSRVRLYNPKRKGERSEWGSFAPSMVFPYRHIDGSLFGYVLRHDLTDGGKETPMVMFTCLPDGTETWCRFPFPKPRPLYGLHELGDRQVLVVEGEKCRDKLRRATGRAVVSWAGGTQGVKHTDWSPLAGRDVIIWPDFDAPGIATALQIAVELTELGAKVRFVGHTQIDAASDTEEYTFEDWKAGALPSRCWDSADAADAGWTKAQLDDFMKETMRPFSPVDLAAEKVPVLGQGKREKPSTNSDTPVLVHDDPTDVVDHTRTPDDDRPMIAFYESDISEVVSRACQMACEREAPLYARGTSLFRLVRIEGADAPILVPADRVSMIEIFSKIIRWMKPDARVSQGWKPVSCPSLVAEAALARQGEWPFPQIKAIVSTPTMRRDGSILSKQGFDRQSGILFESDERWPAMPEHPTKKDAQNAVAKVRKLLSTFPFVSDVDCSAAIALMLTAIIRPSMKTAPLFGINATAPGTGKSKLVDVAAVLATGRVAAVDSYPTEEEELRKTVSARLMQGGCFITLDNASAALRSDFLCQVLSQEEVSSRVLGASRTVTLPTAVTFCATGNGLRFAGDLTRRVVLINLDAGVERPEERVFEQDVVEVAQLRRVEIVTACLTILRAFMANKGEKVVPALGSFEQWSNMVRSALVWLGMPDPLANSIKVRDNDPEKERTSAILSALPAGKPWTASDIAKMVDEGIHDPIGNRRHEALVDALSEFIERGRLKTTGFSGFLRKNQGRIVNGHMIVSAGKNRLNAVLWNVETDQ